MFFINRVQEFICHINISCKQKNFVKPSWIGTDKIPNMSRELSTGGRAFPLNSDLWQIKLHSNTGRGQIHWKYYKLEKPWVAKDLKPLKSVQFHTEQGQNY